jgi:hypothetical protein
MIEQPVRHHVAAWAALAVAWLLVRTGLTEMPHLRQLARRLLERAAQ